MFLTRGVNRVTDLQASLTRTVKVKITADGKTSFPGPEAGNPKVYDTEEDGLGAETIWFELTPDSDDNVQLKGVHFVDFKKPESHFGPELSRGVFGAPTEDGRKVKLTVFPGDPDEQIRASYKINAANTDPKWHKNLSSGMIVIEPPPYMQRVSVYFDGDTLAFPGPHNKGGNVRVYNPSVDRFYEEDKIIFELTPESKPGTIAGITFPNPEQFEDSEPGNVFGPQADDGKFGITQDDGNLVLMDQNDVLGTEMQFSYCLHVLDGNGTDHKTDPKILNDPPPTGG